MRRLDVVVVPFGSYAYFHGDKLLDWYGAQRCHRMFAHRTLLDAGLTVAGSSGHPCGPYEPLLGLQSSVTRRSAGGALVGESQRISALEALHLYTVGSATASGEQDRKERLAPGFLADFTVLGQDPLTTAVSDLGSLPVQATWVDGREAWAA